MDTLAWGFGLIEGPRWAPDGSLYFSDVRGGGVRRRAGDGTIDVVIPKRRGVGGIALHADGGIVVSGRNICHVRDGQTRILYERDDVGGFNDLFTDAAGRVYVGSLRDDPFEIGGEERRTGDAYRIDAAGRAVTLYDGVGLSNGIGFSPDGRRLYHVDSVNGIICHDVDEAGDLVAASRRLFARPKGATPDGLAVDTEGFVWVALFGGGGVARFDPDGELDRHVAVPSSSVTSLCFAGDGLRSLVVVTADNTEDPARAGTIFWLEPDEVGAAGLPAPLARI